MHSTDTIRFLAHRNTYIIALAFNPRLRILASGDADGMIRLWNTDTGLDLGSIQDKVGNDFGIGSLTFSPDGILLAACPLDKNDKLTIWNIETHTIIAQVPAKNVCNIAFSPNGKLLACAEESLVLREALTAKINGNLNHPQWPLSVGWHPNGKLLVSGGEDTDSSIRIWDVLTGSQLAVFRPRTYAQNVRAVAFFSDDAVVFVNDREQPSIWHWKSNLEPYPIPSVLHIPTSYPTIISPNGHYAASIDDSDYYILHTINLSTGETTRLQSSHGHDEVIIWATFSPDARQIATADFDGFICIWNLRL